jgi:hypothetical protein
MTISGFIGGGVAGIVFLIFILLRFWGSRD